MQHSRFAHCFKLGLHRRSQRQLQLKQAPRNQRGRLFRQVGDDAGDEPPRRLERITALFVRKRWKRRLQDCSAFPSLAFLSLGKMATFSSFVPSGSTRVATPPLRSALRLR